MIGNDGEEMMKGGLGNIMKQAQKMQENLQKAQAEIAAMEITGESGGGLVSATITGRYEVQTAADRPQSGGRRQGHAGRFGRCRDQRRGSQGRAHRAGENGRSDLGHGSAARHAGRSQTAVLTVMAASPLLNQLMTALRCLPGVGPKSAQRMALHLLERDRTARGGWSKPCKRLWKASATAGAAAI
jgi:hypothetical protein